MIYFLPGICSIADKPASIVCFYHLCDEFKGYWVKILITLKTMLHNMWLVSEWFWQIASSPAESVSEQCDADLS